jgi:hypothetical protein
MNKINYILIILIIVYIFCINKYFFIKKKELFSEHDKSKLKLVYDGILDFYKQNSVDRIIKNNVVVTDINNKDNISLTVVFTTHNRVEQTYFTLASWNNIANNSNINIQVIIVEDTINISYRLDKNRLQYSNLNITHLFINNKIWVNPCLNYNIGFKFIKNDNVVLTNAEICVYGNIYEIINKQLTEKNYLVFDVFEFGKIHAGVNKNNDIYKYCSDFKYDTIMNYTRNRQTLWLQGQYNNRKYHFLTCIHNNILQKIGGFDDEYILYMYYDDDNFVNKIQKLQKLEIRNIYHDKYKVVGVHQWHSRNSTVYHDNKHNQLLDTVKKNYLNKNGKYLNIKDYNSYDELLKII